MNLKEKSFAFFRYYIALKLHFQDNDYDFFRNEARVTATLTSFNGRKDKFHFEKAAHLFDDKKYINKLLVAITTNGDVWIKDIFTPANQNNYLKRMAYLDNFQQKFNEEICKLQTHCLKKRISLNEIDYLKMYNRGILSTEALCFISEHYQLETNDDPLLEQSLKLILRYRPFIQRFYKKHEKEILNSMSKELEILL